MKSLFCSVLVFLSVFLVNCEGTQFKSNAAKSADLSVGQQTTGLVNEEAESQKQKSVLVQEFGELDLGECKQPQEIVKESQLKIYAATMSHTSSQKRDGNPPSDITAKIDLSEGNVLQFSEFSGVAIYRIYHRNIELQTPCREAGFVLDILDSNNVSISSQNITPKFLPEGQVVVPPGATRAVIGFADSAYFDNEPKRMASSGQSEGCNFKLQTIKLCE
jgi:hypothetical protein